MNIIFITPFHISLIAIVCSYISHNVNGSNTQVCRRLPSIRQTLLEVFSCDPIYVSYTEQTEDTLQVDNICYKLLPLAVNGQYLVYGVTTYKNGTTDILLNMLEEYSPGRLISTTLFTNKEQIEIGFACDTLVVYICWQYGGSVDYSNGITSKYGELSPDCFNSVKKLLKSQNLTTPELVRLPMKLQPNCLALKHLLSPKVCAGKRNHNC